MRLSPGGTQTHSEEDRPGTDIGGATWTHLDCAGCGQGDLGWIVYTQGKGYWEPFGWNEEFEALVARIVADYAERHDPSREAGWIPEIGGEPVGSIVCVDAGGSVAKLRLLWVEPAARGHGVGRLLVRQRVEFARETGYASMTLWTVNLLHSARRLYEEEGFTLSEQPVRMFGKDDLVNQVWDLPLRDSTA